jgi:hypothetical protein
MTTNAVARTEAVFRSPSAHNALPQASRVESSERNRPRRVPLFIPADQAYYWSSKWQRDEAETLANIEAGNYETFDDPSDAIRFLLADD